MNFKSLKNFLLPVFAVAICFTVYFESLSNKAIILGDDGQFLSNPSILEFDVLKALTTDTLGQYYPLTVLSMALDWNVCGPTPSCLHFGSLIYHLINVTLVYFVALQIFSLSAIGALFAALLFGLHPLNVEAVSWISARNQVFSASIQLSVILAYWQFLNSKNKKWYFTSLCFFVLALFAKVICVILPLVLVLLDVVHEQPQGQSLKNFFSYLKNKVPFLILTLPVGILTFKLASSNEQWSSVALDLPQRFFWALKGPVFYLSRIIFPQSLTFFYDVSAVHLRTWEWAGFVTFDCVFFWMIRSKSDLKGSIFLSLGVFALYYLPVSKIIPFGNEAIFADRYMYFPLVFMSCAFVVMGSSLSKTPALHVSLAAVAALVILVFGFISHKQSLVWRDDATTMSDLVAKYPESATAQNYMGAVWIRQQNLEQAQICLEKAIQLDPQFYIAYPNLGYIYEKKNEPEKALDFYLKTIQMRPQLAQMYSIVGNLYLIKFHAWAKATEYYHQSIERGFYDATTRAGLAEACKNGESAACKSLQEIDKSK